MDIVAAAVLLVGLYLVAAYLALPALWKHHEHEPGLARRPMTTATGSGIPGDPLNVGLVGSEPELAAALMRSGWLPADAITLKSSMAIAASVLLDRPDPEAPVSPLYYEGRREDLAFEKPVGRSAGQRHHVRFWRVLETGRLGRPVWLGAATFDRGVGFSHYTGQVTHHIAADIDAERDLLIADLTAAVCLSEIYEVSGVGPTLIGRNGGGDRYFTDGEIAVGVLKTEAVVAVVLTAGASPPLARANPPFAASKKAIWRMVRRFFT